MNKKHMGGMPHEEPTGLSRVNSSTQPGHKKAEKPTFTRFLIEALRQKTLDPTPPAESTGRTEPYMGIRG